MAAARARGARSACRARGYRRRPSSRGRVRPRRALLSQLYPCGSTTSSWRQPLSSELVVLQHCPFPWISALSCAGLSAREMRDDRVGQWCRARSSREASLERRRIPDHRGSEVLRPT